MPQPTFHLLVASEALARWGDEAPFDCYAAANRNAFLHGAIGPDMGYFPAATRLISDLAHAEGTGDLTRAIAARATSPEMRAFVYGWATHILVDTLFHPLINATAAELEECPSDDERRIQSMHIRLEIGLDVLAHRMRPDLQRIRLAPFLDDRSARQLAQAFADVHDIDFLPAPILTSHRRVTQFLGPLMTIQFAMLRGSNIGLSALGLVVRSIGGGNNEATSFLRPQITTPAFMKTAEHLTTIFFRLFARDARDGLRNFPNYDAHRGGVTEPAFESYEIGACSGVRA